MTDLKRTGPKPPHSQFESSADVVADPTLSKNEKLEALGNLEQDAQQLSVASNEGMIGGEVSQLQEVMKAREILERTPMQHAYALVLQDLQAIQAASPRDGMQTLADHAVEVLQAIQRVKSNKDRGQLENLRPGFEAEAAVEAALEKLDP